MFTRRYSEETVAVAVIYAARQASGVLQTSWNQDVFSVLFSRALEPKNAQLLQDCSKELYCEEETVKASQANATSCSATNEQVNSIQTPEQ